MEWEEIEQQCDGIMFRAPVPGGWLVRLDYNVVHQDPNGVAGLHPGWDWRPALTFVPDPDHQWELPKTTVKDHPK